MLCSELYEALQLFSANMETERGDAIFILYLRPKLIPSRAGVGSVASSGREPGRALVLVGPGARTHDESRAENEDSTGGSAEGGSQCGKRTCTSVGRRKGAGREGEMGGLGDRLEPRLEWAEGLPGRGQEGVPSPQLLCVAREGKVAR